jgi:ParB-like chromosome segregation protein Spo0J
MEPHPIASLFPLMNEQDLAALTADIRAHGLLEPITVYQGMILDGRNRWLACERAGVTPVTVEWDGQGSPLTWVLSKNLYRYHLTPGQRAAIAVEVEERFATKLREQQIVAIGLETLTPNIRLATISEVEEAQRIKEQAPALFEEVLKGTMTVASASSMLYWRQRQQAEAAQFTRAATPASPGPASPTGNAPRSPAQPPPSQDKSLYDIATSQEEAEAQRALDRAVREVQSLAASTEQIRQARATGEPEAVASALRKALGDEKGAGFATQLGEAAFYLACIAYDLGYRPDAEDAK